MQEPRDEVRIDETWLDTVETKLAALERGGDWSATEGSVTVSGAMRALLAEVTRLRREQRVAEQWLAVMVRREGGTIEIRKRDVLGVHANDTVTRDRPSWADGDVVVRLRYLSGEPPR